MQASRMTSSRFGEEHFGGAQLGDVRRQRRLVSSATETAKHPGGIGDAPGDAAAQIHGVFARLKHLITLSGSDMHHLVKATYYVSDDDAYGGSLVIAGFDLPRSGKVPSLQAKDGRGGRGLPPSPGKLQ